MTSPSFLLVSTDKSDEFEFRKDRRGKVRSIDSEQYVHPTGLVFARIIQDTEGRTLVFGIVNN